MVEFRITAIACALAFCVTTKYVDDAVLNFLGDLCQVHQITRPGWTFNFEVIAVVLVEALQGLDEKEVYRKLRR